MKLLHVIDSLDIGGAETMLLGLCAIWKRSRGDVEVYVLREGGQLDAEMRKLGVPVHCSGSGSFYSPLHALLLARFIQSRQFDLVHVHLYPAQLWACIGVRLAGTNIPMVTTEHCTSNRRREHGLFRQIERWMYSRYAAVCCPSTAAERALSTWLGTKHLNTYVIANGIDLARFARTSKTQSNPPPRALANTVVCVASLQAYKGHEVLMRAVSKLPAVELLLVGEGPMRLSLERLADDLLIAHRVRFLGVRTDVREVLELADIYVQPSLSESFGIAVVEAMATGLPVIASDVPGLSNIVGAAGILFKVGSPEDLTKALQRLLSDSELRLSLGMQARIRSQDYSIDTTSMMYRRLYHSVAKGAGVDEIIAAPEREFAD